jgi:hypothetical protein
MSETIDSAQKKKNRSFKVKLSSEDQLYGRYNGDSPYQAANKALSEIIRNRVKNSESVDGEINFYLVESTKGSGKKSHQYTGKRIKLENPVTYKVGDQEIVKNYKNVLKKVKKNTNDGSETVTRKKATAKKAVDKKAVDKKAVDKKAVDKKVVDKKAVDKKAPAKKTPAKKASVKAESA